jgi:hypothetical protein
MIRASSMCEHGDCTSAAKEESVMPANKKPRAGERKRDEEREDDKPKFGGVQWEVADERGEDERFGKARNEEPPDAMRDSTSIAEEPPRLDESRRAEQAGGDVNVESSGQRAGIGRGEKPRKPKSRTKPNPKRHTKTKGKAKKRR